MDRRILQISLDISDTENKLNFLVDSGADISLVKLNVLNDDAIYYPDLNCRSNGISSSEINTFGLCKCNIILPDDKILNHQFQILIIHQYSMIEF